MHTEENYRDGILDGIVIKYSSDGKVIAKDLYKNGQFVREYMKYN